VTSYRSGAVLIIAALALFFHSFPTSSQEQQSPTIQAQPQTGSASDQAQNPTISVNTQADKSPSAASEDEAAAKAREEARQIRDVAAQESMAQAAWRMVCLTILQIVIGALTIFFLGWTVLETRRTANAANKTVRAMDDTAQRQLRAYISHKPDGIQYEYVHEAEHGDDRVVQFGPLKYSEFNFGVTPANNVKMRVRVLHSSDPPSDFEKGDFISLRVMGYIAPRQDIGTITGHENQTKLFLYGDVEYDDIFENRWRRRFAFNFDCDRSTGEKPAERWHAHDTHNDEIWWNPDAKAWEPRQHSA
jgi:hypothetical protein